MEDFLAKFDILNYMHYLYYIELHVCVCICVWCVHTECRSPWRPDMLVLPRAGVMRTKLKSSERPLSHLESHVKIKIILVILKLFYKIGWKKIKFKNQLKVLRFKACTS